ncbi:NUDIX domain-containing protein [Candidatus Roizmanbacteria bacterium]|nr:NUDIX domain-containing protein [Candidatus Roizmanbacteria bacterium]
MIDTFRKEILKLRNKKYVDKKILRQFINRLGFGKLTLQQNPFNHYCSFFVPFDLDSKMIFVGHHIKADQWIPPGGHIEQNESPIKTVYREFREELNHQLLNEIIKPFDLSITTEIRNLTRSCRIHYDFWYLVQIEKKDFNFAKSEFYEMYWLPIDTAIQKAKRQSIINPLIHLNDNLGAI